jgi:hypothetical protein
MSIIADGDAAITLRDTSELDAHRGCVGIVSVLDELGDSKNFVADQLGTDELEEPGTWSELDQSGLHSLGHLLSSF